MKNPTRLLPRIGRSLRVRAGSIAAAVTLGAMQMAVFAQDNPPPRPPKVTEAPAAPKVVMYLVVVALAAGVVFASTMKVKRGHQD
ncbi:MAG: hypothetical protein JKY96_01395 [Phycisphaerales bacterium]|nr:hypothetical protein [Phycisphaerales bacterium]